MALNKLLQKNKFGHLLFLLCVLFVSEPLFGDSGQALSIQHFFKKPSFVAINLYFDRNGMGRKESKSFENSSVSSLEALWKSLSERQISFRPEIKDPGKMIVSFIFYAFGQNQQVELCGAIFLRKTLKNVFFISISPVDYKKYSWGDSIMIQPFFLPTPRFRESLKKLLSDFARRKNLEAREKVLLEQIQKEFS